MSTKRLTVPALLVIVAIFVAFGSLHHVRAQSSDAPLSPFEELGKQIFFDEALSLHENQSCASCHAPEVGWTGPDQAVNSGSAVYEGSVASRYGNRKPPSVAYATQSPLFHQSATGIFTGGNFWDGRATGDLLRNPVADQAQGPFLNPAEQALPDSACVVQRVCTGGYAQAFAQVWGRNVCAIDWPTDVEVVCATEGGSVELDATNRARSDTAWNKIALALAAYEGSPEVNAFTSKYDAWLRGELRLTMQEQRGLKLFQGKARCVECHDLGSEMPLFTFYTFDNVGTPPNPEATRGEEADPGLAGYLAAAGYAEEVVEAALGKHKVPTLRNVDLRPDAGFVKAYGHNGYFKSLEAIVHFYNTRDVKPACPGPYSESEALAAGCWPAPEVAANMNTTSMGDLGLTPVQEAALVAFLRTLSDGFTTSRPAAGSGSSPGGGTGRGSGRP